MIRIADIGAWAAPANTAARNFYAHLCIYRFQLTKRLPDWLNKYFFNFKSFHFYFSIYLIIQVIVQSGQRYEWQIRKFSACTLSV